MKNKKLLKKNIFLIGDGELLLFTAKLFNDNKYNVVIISSKRHAQSFLKKNYFQKKLKKIVKFKILNNQKELENIVIKDSLAICFGPSWIFSKKIRSFFKGEMYNIHCLPLPKFMGGAHYTWQILNSNFEGGIYLQKINDKLDRGPIVYKSNFKISKNNTKPKDFYNINYYHGKKFIKKLLNFKLIKKNLVRNQKFFLKSIYFPRLMTKKNAYIDWQWSGLEIKRFCDAFDDPYNGASTFHGSNKVFLKDVKIFNNDKYHPYCAGLVIRKIKKSIYIATTLGTLLVKDLYFENKSSNKLIKKGDRLLTPYKYLENSRLFRPIYK